MQWRNYITERRIYDGHIEIKSEEGKGTAFHIYLPKAHTKEEFKKEDIAKIKGGSETILIVDDEEMILSLAGNLLKKHGYKVLTAIDGEEALKIYKKEKDSIDAVILDLTMPRMSGEICFRKNAKD